MSARAWERVAFVAMIVSLLSVVVLVASFAALVLTS